jgi:hypothetical protein
VDKLRREDSGTFGRHQPTEGSAFEPETIVVGLAWILSLAQIALGVMRGGAFGPDRAIAVAFAVDAHCSRVIAWSILPGARGSAKGADRPTELLIRPSSRDLRGRDGA